MSADRRFLSIKRISNKPLFVATAIAVCTIAVFYSVQHFNFICLDDADYVSDNPNVSSGLSITNLRWAFAAPHFANWHPLTWLSHMLDCDLFGLNPGAHHMMNVLLHAANAGLLFLVLLSMTGCAARSSMVAALFALHPLHVESVAWIAERKDVLSALFWILSIAGYVRYARKHSVSSYLVVALLFLCGCLSKSMVVTLPFVLLLLDYWPLYRIRELQPEGKGFLPVQPQRLWWLGLEKLPLIVVSGATCVITFVSQRGTAMAGLDVLPISVRIENAIISYGRYLWKMLVPTNLAVIYPLRIDFDTGVILGALLLLVTVTFVALRLRRRSPYLAVGWLWYLGTLVPVIGLVQVGEQSIADRYSYLPSIGIFLAIVWGIADLANRLKVPRPYVAAASIAILIACAVTTLRQLVFWKDDVALFSHAARVTTENATAHALLAQALIDRGDDREGLDHLQEALRIRPESPKIHHDCGLLEAKLEKYVDAIFNYREAIRLRPGYAAAYNDLGVALSKTGRLEEAKRALDEAIEKNPRSAQAYNNRGIILGATGKPYEALRDFRRALELNPSQVGALNNLAWLQATDDDPAIRNGHDAVRLARRACELTRFNNSHSLEVLAASQAELGEYDQAIKTIEKALDVVAAGKSLNESKSTSQRLNAARQLYQSHKPFRRKSGALMNSAGQNGMVIHVC